MKITNLKCLVLALCTFGFFSANAQSDSATLRLSMQDAVSYALQNNKTLANAGLAVSEAQKATWAAISAGLPQINATLDYQNMMGFKMEFAGMSIALEPTSNFQASVTQLLFNASYWVGIKMSKMAESMSETAKLQAELDTKQQTKSAYYTILLAEENKNILALNLKNLETIANQTEDMVRVGVAEQTDADQLKVQVAQIKNAISSVERAIEMAYNLLRFHLSVESNTNIVLTQSLEELFTIDAANAVLQAGFDLDSNYSMQLLDQQIDLADKQVALQRAASFPTVAAFYNYTYKIKKSSFDMSPANIIGLQASIPIFASGQRYANTQKAKIQLETARNNRDIVAEQLLMQEKQLRFNLKSTIEAYQLQKESYDLAQRVFDSMTRKYKQGTSSSMSLTTANTNLLTAQSSYINAMMEVFTAQIELEKLINQ